MQDFLRSLTEGVSLNPELSVFTVILGVMTLFGMYAFLRMQARRRLMEDMPTSRIRSASQGYVELEGRARPMEGLPLVSPLTRSECAWYRYRIEEKDTDSKGNTRWNTLESGRSSQLFILDDDTGECVVDPEDAEVDPVHKRVWYGAMRHPLTQASSSFVKDLLSSSDYRYTEELILPGERVYALGLFVSHDPLHVSLNDRTRDTVIAWKNDPDKLRAFDHDGDGKLDAHEFDALRETARKHAEADHRVQAAAGQTHILRADPHGRPYVLSTHDQHKLAARLRLRAWLSLAAALGGLGLFVHLITHVLPMTPS
ncbi:MAG: GIDE domain-containing protein [Pseudomonadota bacterium]